MRAKVGVLVAVAGLLVSAVPVLAHHSFAAEYDASKPVTLKGTVTKIEWTNPHARFYLDVKGADGALTNWNMELASPNALQRNGWTRKSLNVGDEVTVQGSAARMVRRWPMHESSRSRAAARCLPGLRVT